MSRKPGPKAKAADESTKASVGRGNSVAHVYDTLRAEILSLKLEPGEIIDDVALCERLGLSRTPIREALSRLSGDGLVVQSPNRGFQVAPVNLMETPRFAEALSLLQRAVLRTAALRRTTQDLGRIEETYEAFASVANSADPLELTLRNRAFHGAIADACHNRYLAEGYTRLLDQGMRMLSVPFAYDPGPTDSVTEHTDRVEEDHREMVEAIRDRDADRAERLGAEHAELFRSRFIKYLEQNLLDQMSVDDAPRAEPAPVRAAAGRRAK